MLAPEPAAIFLGTRLRSDWLPSAILRLSESETGAPTGWAKEAAPRCLNYSGSASYSWPWTDDYDRVD